MTGILRSWVTSANDPGTEFPLNNLPCGVFDPGDGDPRCGVAIGDHVLDLRAVEEMGLLGMDLPLFDVPFWNEVMEAGPDVWVALRARLSALLAEDSAKRVKLEPVLFPQADVTMHLPFLVSEYTDFYAGRHHAFNVGSMFRDPANALPPNWLHIPIGYNGRASSVVVSGTDVRRPWGQVRGPNDTAPRFAPSQRFDFELELGAVVGTPSEGMVSVAEADQMIFGYVLLNDWSARDIQAWEYQPLGPFQAKATATTISPWIVTAAALAPFRANTPPREVPLLPHLAEPGPMGFDIALEVDLNGETVSRTNTRELYYSPAQQLCHHTTSGCPMNAGDLLGSGTISGPEKGNRGSMLELTWGGKEPLDTAQGPRSFLQDSDRVTLRGHAQGDGFRIGFGDCTGMILPAHADPVGAGR
jgi:fumarylacetoacetase